VWTQFKMRGDNDDANDTKATIAQIVKLRADRARLLGYESHAHWRMEDTMAQDPERAMELMMRVWPAAVARVEEEVADMRPSRRARAAHHHRAVGLPVLRREGAPGAYDLDQNEVKPYFELNNMMQAAFWTAGQLYGLTFHEITGQVPVFHPGRARLRGREGDRHVGLFYSDNFARTGKRSGAWASDVPRPRDVHGREPSRRCRRTTTTS
jgi:peptidyl-dipeptidase Dcp